jgi:large subunit ribosomal protein L9
VIGVARVKVVLRQPVTKLGDPGDLVTVSGGYARNFLIPRGLAVPATKGNLKQAEDWAKSKGAKAAKDLSNAEGLKAKLESQALGVTAQAGPDGRLFGSVTSSDVAEALAAQLGVTIDRHDLELSEPIRHLGNHQVQVKLHPEVAATVTVEVSAAS